jgi:hypothetical protein
MDFIESSLCRLQESVRRFVIPSAAFGDVRALKAQIELRQRALTDIEIIRCRLRLFISGDSSRRRRIGGKRRRARTRSCRARRQYG